MGFHFEVRETLVLQLASLLLGLLLFLLCHSAWVQWRVVWTRVIFVVRHFATLRMLLTPCYERLRANSIMYILIPDQELHLWSNTLEIITKYLY
jgi:hypothetical protein